jgi:hypothetical protein
VILNTRTDSKLANDLITQLALTTPTKSGLLGQMQDNLKNKAADAGKGYWNHETMLLPVMGNPMGQINPAYTQAPQQMGDPMQMLAQYRQTGQMPAIGEGMPYQPSQPFTPEAPKFESVPTGNKTFVATDTKGVI